MIQLDPKIKNKNKNVKNNEAALKEIKEKRKEETYEPINAPRLPASNN